MEFDENLHKSVVVIADSLPLGLAMNALSVISVSMGRNIDGIVGHDVFSKDSICYPGVIKTPLPVLKASHDVLDAIHSELKSNDNFKLSPFSCLAQSCRTYEEYEGKLSAEHSDELKLSGIGIVGPKKDINKLTGNLPLYK
ncbi:DUF2000 domain-containing protein [Photorhabdus laumondii]|uniref:DUF2000 domain-containing protein n=1 Tax=Photorhabdus laumondii subsp. clarkei TaxID=2029685 RepID=A0A329VEF0_9GAMM|nr:DUF2000 domain-containing protein [Photorhabdus laumondii]PQQ36508.1 DUF2000 domain-containing protein [Photorhabdus luminescens]RAW90283.1 hypothetical protein CKY01_13925 [Photorhabdus laumondii subsp. clarkei]